MTENIPKNREFAIVHRDKVYQEPDGSIFFWKTVKVQTWNDFEKKFEDAPLLIRREKVTPEECIEHYQRSIDDEILIAKKIQSEDKLQDSEVVFEMDVSYTFKNEEAFKYMYFYRCNRTNRIMVKDFNSGMAFAAGVNNPDYVTKGKTRKLPENSLILRTRPIYVLNSSSGELEERLPEPTNWGE